MQQQSNTHLNPVQQTQNVPIQQNTQPQNQSFYNLPQDFYLNNDTSLQNAQTGNIPFQQSIQNPSQIIQGQNNHIQQQQINPQNIQQGYYEIPPQQISQNVQQGQGYQVSQNMGNNYPHENK